MGKPNCVIIEAEVNVEFYNRQFDFLFWSTQLFGSVSKFLSLPEPTYLSHLSNFLRGSRHHPKETLEKK